MNLTDKKFKLVYLIETAFLYLLAHAVVYCVLLLSARVGLFELSHRVSPLWRLNPFLTLPHMAAIAIGMAIAPVVWEKAIRSTSLKQIGLAIPQRFLRELICGAGLFVLFVAYCHIVVSKRIELPSLSPYIMLLLSTQWLLVAFAEEVLYRGIIQRRLSNLCEKYCGLILASGVFAFAGHPGEPWVDNLIVRLPFGLIIGYAYMRSRRLLIPVGIHWAFNMFFAI